MPTIRELSGVTSLSGSDQLAVFGQGDTRKASVDQIAEYVISALPESSSDDDNDEQKYQGGQAVLLMQVLTGGAGSRNVIQGHVLDLDTSTLYAMQLKESADSFFIKKCKFGNPRIAGNVVDITPLSNLVVHQGLFLEIVGGVRYFWAGSDSASQPSLVRVRESDGVTDVFNFYPALTPGLEGSWAGNVTHCLDVTGTKLFIRVARSGVDYVLRYDFAAFKASSTTVLAEASFLVATEQSIGTSLQGLAADEDTVYILSGNTTQALNKLLYAYDRSGVIKWMRNIAPHYFDAFYYGTKCEVEGLHMVRLPNGQRVLTMMVELGAPTHNVHRLYAIPQFSKDAAFGAATPGLYQNDYGVWGVGGVPVGSNSIFNVRNPNIENTRFTISHPGCIGPTDSGFQLVLGDDLTANIFQREAAFMRFYTNNLLRMALAFDKTQLTIGGAEPGPLPAPGPRIIVAVPALSTMGSATDAQEAFRITFLEGSQDLGVGEGTKLSLGGTLSTGTYLPALELGFTKNDGSDSSLISDAFLALVQTVGGAGVRLFNFTVAGFFNPLADATQAIGQAAKRWAAGYFVQVFFGAGTASLTSGAGAPEAVATAGVGSIYTDTTNGVMYVKKTGTGNTGWKLVTQAA